jgi:site-specific DNA-methyltransferase (cytosine-N4-specific)
MTTAANKKLSTKTVAQMAGVHRDTLLRWLREGLIPEPSRDRHNWRVYTEEEAQQVVRFVASASEEGPPPEAARTDTADTIARLLRLKQINWDFAEAKTRYLTHGLHPYPAKFIPQIPNALIQELSSVEETVADIFCGSGTTLVESLILKRNVVGVDANPLACLISEAKVTQVVEGDADALRAVVNQSRSVGNALTSTREGSLFGSTKFATNEPRPDHDAIKFWFEPFIIEELAQITAWCRALPTPTSRRIALVSLSAIIITVSKQDSDTRYVRRDKNLSPGDAFIRFANTLEDAIHAVEEFTELVEPRFISRVHHGNILEGPDIGQVDLVVCSPPYPNAYSYHLYHMTRMVWLGMDQPTFKKAEIGSHRKYSNKGASGATINTFKDEMLRIFKWLRHHLKKHRYACFVVGNSIIDKKLYNNGDLIAEAASESGFVEAERIGRQMQDTKKAFNPAYGKIKQEQILILRNMKGVN